MNETHRFPPPVREVMRAVKVYTCQRCGFEFEMERLPEGKLPGMCKNPKCRSKDWQRPYVHPEQAERMRQWHAGTYQGHRAPHTGASRPRGDETHGMSPRRWTPDR